MVATPPTKGHLSALAGYPRPAGAPEPKRSIERPGNISYGKQKQATPATRGAVVSEESDASFSRPDETIRGGANRAGGERE